VSGKLRGRDKKILFTPSSYGDIGCFVSAPIVVHLSCLCASDKIHSSIQKAYKHYGNLKNDKNRHDTWLASLIEAQATALQVPKNLSGNASKEQNRSKTMLGWYKSFCHPRPTMQPNPCDWPKLVRPRYSNQIVIQSQTGEIVFRRSRMPIYSSNINTILTTTSAWNFLGSKCVLKSLWPSTSRHFWMPTGYGPHGYCLIQAMQWPDNLPQIPSRKLEEVTTGWHKAQEATSSAPSAVHFGHYMAGMFNPMIAVFNARLANLGFTMGYSLKWWQTRLNVMLEKQAGNMKVENSASSFNQNNKWLGHAIMFNAEKYLQMAPKQYGI